MQVNKLQIQTSAGAALVILNREKLEFQLLQGALWIRTEDSATIAYGKVQISGSGDFWVEKLAKGQLRLVNLDAVLKMQSRNFTPGLPVTQVIPVGFENWVGALDSNGEIQQGVLRPIKKTAFLLQWNHIQNLSAKDAKAKLAEYKKLWTPAINGASDIYQIVWQRQMASVEDAQAKEQERQRQRQQELQKLRQMYRERYDYSDAALQP